MDDISQLYHEALVALAAGLTTEDENGISWEDRGSQLQIKRFGSQIRIIRYVWDLGNTLNGTGDATRFPGGEYWYLNGKIHRDAGPAVIYPNGRREWYHGGLLHRTDGPAIERPDGRRIWCINGVAYTHEEFLKLAKKS